MIKITGLWANTDKNGKPYFSGNLNGAKILVYENSFKEPDSNQPDFNMFIAEGKKKDPETFMNETGKKI